MEYMRSNLVHQEVIQPDDKFDLDTLRQILSDRFDAIDYRSAMQDVWEYVTDEKPPSNWNADLFKATLGRLREAE